MCLVPMPWPLFHTSRLYKIRIWCKHLHQKGKGWRFYNIHNICWWLHHCQYWDYTHVQKVKDILQHEFDISNEGEIHYTLGNAITRNWQVGWTILH